MIGTPIPAAMLQALRSSRRVLIASHIRPDGDAIGSLLGMGEILRALGKDVTVSLQDSVPFELQRVPLANTIVHPRRLSGQYDTFISVDASTPDRLGDVLTLAPKPYTMIVIDHHVTNLGFGDLNWVNADQAACCEMLVHMAEALDVPLSPTLAQILMTGLVTDTLCFRTSATTADTLAAGMKLRDAGADLTEITENILDQRTFPVLKLWGEVLDDAMIEDGVLWVTMARSQFEAAGIGDYEDGSLSSMLIRTDGADISVTFIEKRTREDEPAVEVSIRSRSNIDISGVAHELGGGGHAQAGGVTILGDFNSVVPNVVARLKSVRAQSR